MSIAALVIACLLAGTAIAGAAEPTPAQGASPFPSSTLKLRSTTPVPNEVHAYAPDRFQVQRPSAESGRPPNGRVCFNQAETRDKIALHRLADPLRALRLGRLEGDALSAKLCRWKPDEFVYEVHVLRRDGRVLRVFMNAQSGEALNGQGASGGDKDRN